MSEGNPYSMIVIGIDPHKTTHTGTALDPATNSDVGSLRIEASLAEYQRLILWAKPWPERTWAIENADGLGHHLALWLLARGEVVLDIPTTATARVRELSRGGRRKNDRIDAAAAASVAALQGDARQVYPETTTDALALLDETSSQPVTQQNPRDQSITRAAARVDGRRRTDVADPRQGYRRTRWIPPPHRPRPDSGGPCQGAHCRRPTLRQADQGQRGQDRRSARRARHHSARGRRRRICLGRPPAGPHRPGDQVRLGCRIRELHRHRARPHCER